MPVRIDLEVKNAFHDGDTTSFNIVGEIAGSDKADEVVMLGAHFDSWHGATGATDNAAGSAVMMEAMRILKQSGLKLRRTVRIGAPRQASTPQQPTSWCPQINSPRHIPETLQ